MSTTEINWRHNCLTTGPHDGRPERLWSMPLLQALTVFRMMDLKEIVVTRIYNDAMRMVEYGDEPRLPPEWAEAVKELAEERYSGVLDSKVNELNAYYISPGWHRDTEGVIALIKLDNLNSHYSPLHSHDSINMLCRILGVSCSIDASQTIKGE